MTPVEFVTFEALVGGLDLPPLEVLTNRPPWMADALCREHPEVNWFIERGESAEPAKAVCRSCLVQSECADFALAQGTVHGVWGGLSGRELRRLRRHAA